VKKNLCTATLFFLAAILICPYPAVAGMKTFTKEYTYAASEMDSKVSCRAVAMEQVKRLLLEELGTYLESTTEVADFQLTKDQITAITAGIVSAEIVKESWNGREYYLMARISADPDDVLRSVDTLRKDREKTAELMIVRKKAEELSRELERMRKELETAKTSGKEITAEKYGKTADKLSAMEWFEKGHALDVRGYNEKAIEAYTMAIKLNPRLAEAYHGRGLAAYNMSRYQPAIKDYSRAIELNPNYGLAYGNRGFLYNRIGDYRKSLEDLSRAIELRTDPVPGAFYLRGEIYYRLRKYQQAIDDYTRIIALFSENGTGYVQLGYYGRGRAYRRLGEFDKALEDFNRALELDPQHAYAYYDRCMLYDHLKQYDRAVSDCRAAAKYGVKKGAEYVRSKGARIE